MDKKIIVATNNNGKITEIKSIFSDFKIYSLNDLKLDIDVEEDSDTFEGNALKKAKTIAKELHSLCIADDSGIVIDILNGFPGVKTKRWMNGSDRDRNLAILEKMKNIPKENRTVHFVTAIALADDNLSVVQTHTIHGYISKEIRGKNGFGFDEIFELEDGRTLAELSPEEKNFMSSRKIALEIFKYKI